MTYKLAFFDIDGTLLNKEKEIPVSTMNAIQKLKSNGIEVLIATGRSPYHSFDIASRLGIESMVNFNGSYVTYKGDVLHKNPIDQSFVSKIKNIASDKGHCVTFFGLDTFSPSHEEHPFLTKVYTETKIPNPTFIPDFINDRDIYQLYLHCQTSEEFLYKELFDDLQFLRWHDYSIDLVPKNGSKAVGIEKILKHKGISPEEVIAFGDGLNDIEMLSYVGMGVAMGNCEKEVIPHANFVTKHVSDNGIEFALRHLELI